MYLIDTNIIIWVLRGNKIYLDIFEKLKSKETLSISTITIAEIYKNIFPTELAVTQNLLNELTIFDLTSNIAKEAGYYWKQYIKKFASLHILDCMIAATAKEHGLTLVTLNTRHFPMGDIKVISPSGLYRLE